MWNDLCYAIRQLRRAPGFALAAIGTLALAIGATTALVSVLRATLLNPTPFPHVERVVSLQDTNRRDANFNGITNVSRAVVLNELRTSAGGRVFEALGFFYADSVALSLHGEPPRSTPYIAASGRFFQVLKAKPLLGRMLTPADDAPGAPETTVLSYGLWQRLFAGSPGAVGRTVDLNGKPATIVGVMPRSFAYPTGTELWKPAHIPMLPQAYRGTSSRYLNVIARLREQVTQEQARQAVDLLAARLARAYPSTDAEWGFRVEPLQAVILGEYRQALFLLAAAVAMLLLIACANVAGLQLSRNAAREPEIAIRRMLGIGGARLLRQLLTESLVLFAAGGALGVLLAAGLLRAFTAALPAALLAFTEPRLDRGTLLAMLALTLLTGLVCGVAPALQFGLRAPRQGRAVIANTRRFGQAFASAQTALALVLLALGFSLLAQLYRLTHAPLGFESSRVLAVSAHLPFGTEPATVHRFYQQLKERFATIPGVDAVGAINALPFNSFSAPRSADIVGRPPTPHGDSVSAEGRKFTPSYTVAMRIPLLAGRGFTLQDGEPNAPAVVLINQAFQRTYFAGENPVGKRLRYERGVAEIVGVVADTHGTGGSLADAPVLPEIDEPEQGYWPDMHFVLRTALPAPALDRRLRKEAAALDPGVALGALEPFTRQVDRVLAGPRLNSGLLAALAGLALVLVLTGVYGVVAFSAAQRTRELALRLALGAPRAAIFGMLLRESALVAAPGLAFGLAGAWASLRVLPVALRQGNVFLPLLLAGAVLVLAITFASTLPARRAASIDPVIALRSE